MLLMSTAWPGRGKIRQYGGGAAGLADTEDADAVPLLWVSALLSEKFWATEVAKHGYAALKAPRLVSVTRTYGDSGKLANSAKNSNSQVHLEVETPLDSFRERLRTTALDFNNAKRWWIYRHLWWSEEGFKWAQSPWRSEAWRSAVKTFKLAHAVRDQHKAYRQVKDGYCAVQQGDPTVLGVLGPGTAHAGVHAPPHQAQYAAAHHRHVP